MGHSCVIFLMDPAGVIVRAIGIRQRDAKQTYRCVRVFNCEHFHPRPGCTLVGGFEKLSRKRGQSGSTGPVERCDSHRCQEALWKRSDRSRFSPWTMSRVC